MSGIFICYRREDSQSDAWRLYDGLCDRFGKQNVFMDTGTLQPGAQWAEVIDDWLARCDAAIVLIGLRWVGDSERKKPRLHEPDDHVRLETASMLKEELKAAVSGDRQPSSIHAPTPASRNRRPSHRRPIA